MSSTIPLNEALESMNQLIDELGLATKSTDLSYTVDIFGGISTKSQDVSLPDTTLYIINFADESGYAILSAQRKVSTKVFCITEAGTFSAVDIGEAIELMESNPSQTEEINPKDSSWNDIGNLIIPSIIASSVINQMQYGYVPDEGPMETKTDTYIGTPDTSAMLETKWRQESPFNSFRSDNAPAGCVAIATAQIIEFNALNHSYTSFVSDNNQSFNWTLLRTVCNKSDPDYAGTAIAQSEASSFLQYVGLSKNCNISYGVNGSSGYADGAKRTFNNMGYNSVRKYLGFENADKNRAIAQITSGFPMYMDGSRSGGGHAWVLDGLYVRKVYENGTYARTENMFHINWGWNGEGDGYYVQGVFDTTQRKTIESGVDSGDSAPSRNYTWNYRTITYSL